MRLFYEREGSYYVAIREDWPLSKEEAVSACHLTLEWLNAPLAAATSQNSAPSSDSIAVIVETTPDSTAPL
jgi:hypothetical protein